MDVDWDFYQEVQREGKKFKRLAKEGQDTAAVKIAAPYHNVFDAVSIATRYGRLELVKKLIVSGWDPNRKGQFGCTPLHTAVNTRPWGRDRQEE